MFGHLFYRNRLHRLILPRPFFVQHLLHLLLSDTNLFVSCVKIKGHRNSHVEFLSVVVLEVLSDLGDFLLFSGFPFFPHLSLELLVAAL